MVAAHAGDVIDPHQVKGAFADQVIVDHVGVPHLDAHVRIAGGMEGENFVPGGIAVTVFAHCRPVLLSAEVDLHVGVLDGAGSTMLSRTSVSWVMLASIGRTTMDISLSDIIIL